MKTGKLIYKICLIYGRYGHCQVWVRHSPKSNPKVEDNFWTHICQLATTTNQHPAQPITFEAWRMPLIKQMLTNAPL